MKVHCTTVWSSFPFGINCEIVLESKHKASHTTFAQSVLTVMNLVLGQYGNVFIAKDWRESTEQI